MLILPHILLDALPCVAESDEEDEPHGKLPFHESWTTTGSYMECKVKKRRSGYQAGDSEYVVFGKLYRGDDVVRLALYSPTRQGTPIRIISPNPRFSKEAAVHVEVLAAEGWTHVCDCLLISCLPSTNHVYLRLGAYKESVAHREHPWLRLVMKYKGRTAVLHYFGHASRGDRVLRAAAYLKHLFGKAKIPEIVAQKRLHAMLSHAPECIRSRRTDTE
jgi:hypothetical protein